MNILLCLIFLIALSSLFQLYSMGKKEQFFKLLAVYNVYTLVHVSYTFIAINFFATQRFVDAGAPFGFGYGPMLYYGLIMSGEKTEVKLKKNSWLHLLPIPFFWAAFIMLLADRELRDIMMWKYYTVLATGQCLSFFAYGLWSIFASRPRLAMSDLGSRSRVLSIGGVLILFMASFGLVILLSRVVPHKSTPPTIGLYIIYGMLLSVQLSVARYLYRIRKGKPGNVNPDEIAGMEISSESRVAYQKSAVPLPQLMEYHSKLQKLISEKQIHLDSSLSLDRVSELLRIPNHHTSQLFNIVLNESFNAYISTLRVQHSCELLKDEQQMSIDDVAFKSGFGSKASFNRVFKNLKGCTPSQYRKG